ncbi:MAG: hypothetical protein AVDCRST_MAG05-444, partial [uncultured Rubrobacteraceae bacterium]
CGHTRLWRSRTMDKPSPSPGSTLFVRRSSRAI